MKASELETVIFLNPSAAGGSAVDKKVGGVPVLLRMLRVLKRAGVRRVQLVTPRFSDKAKRFSRSVGLEVSEAVRWSADGGAPALVLSADLAFQKGFVEELVAQWRPPGWLRFASDSDPGSPGALVGEGLKGEFEDLESVDAAVSTQSPIVVQTHAMDGQPCVPISDSAAATRFHRLVERSMTKDTDAMFARWNRKVSIPLTRVLARLPISPNMMTYITLAVAAAGAWLLSLGGYWEMLAGGLLTQLSSILDGNDGELARLKVMDSDYGTWLDTLCDYVSYFLTFGGVTMGVYARAGDSHYLWIGALTLVGIGLGMATTSYFRKKHTPKGQANELTKIVIERLETKASNPFTFVAARLRHFATRATFSYFIVLFGLLDWWDALLWFALVGSWMFVAASVYHAGQLGEGEG